MNRALLAFVLRRHRFALIACWVVPVLIALAVGLIYPTYAKEREAIERLTKFFGQFFGGDVIDLLSPNGFLTLPFQHPLTLLMLAISAAVGAARAAGRRPRPRRARPAARDAALARVARAHRPGAPFRSRR